MKSPDQEVIGGEENGNEIRTGTAVLSFPQHWPLDHWFKPDFLSDTCESCLRTGLCVCHGWSVPVPAGLCVLGTSWAAEPGPALSLGLKSEKLAIQALFWPIDGALQLIFCLELEFGNSFNKSFLIVSCSKSLLDWVELPNYETQSRLLETLQNRPD